MDKDRIHGIFYKGTSAPQRPSSLLSLSPKKFPALQGLWFQQGILPTEHAGIRPGLRLHPPVGQNASLRRNAGFLPEEREVPEKVARHCHAGFNGAKECARGAAPP